jgi:hypothetical protein
MNYFYNKILNSVNILMSESDHKLSYILNRRNINLDKKLL